MQKMGVRLLKLAQVATTKHHEARKAVPIRELTYPNLGKGKSSSKVPVGWDLCGSSLQGEHDNERLHESLIIAITDSKIMILRVTCVTMMIVNRNGCHQSSQLESKNKRCMTCGTNKSKSIALSWQKLINKC